VSADWSLFDGSADGVPSVDELDPMFSSFGDYTGSDCSDVDASNGEQTDLTYGSNQNFTFDTLVNFSDDETFLGL